MQVFACHTDLHRNIVFVDLINHWITTYKKCTWKIEVNVGYGVYRVENQKETCSLGHGIEFLQAFPVMISLLINQLIVAAPVIAF